MTCLTNINNGKSATDDNRETVYFGKTIAKSQKNQSKSQKNCGEIAEKLRQINGKIAAKPQKYLWQNYVKTAVRTDQNGP